jgi:mono/diheme cytochrome c family protein
VKFSKTIWGACLLLAVASARSESLMEHARQVAAAKTNPLAGQERAQRAGAKLFARECASCHGENGLGGAGKAPPLRQNEVYDAPPGALFWILRNGALHRGMPSFAHLPEAQRWQIITWLKARP